MSVERCEELRKTFNVLQDAIESGKGDKWMLAYKSKLIYEEWEKERRMLPWDVKLCLDFRPPAKLFIN